jgi:hypothetical protein
VPTLTPNINISPYGGIVPILTQIARAGIPQVINSCLGKRPAQSKYEYDEILIAWVMVTLCGGKSLDHISQYRKKFSIIPELTLPSHDTLGRVMKGLATETFSVKTKSHKQKKKQGSQKKGTYTSHTENVALNRMLIQSTIKMGLLKPGQPYTLDIDATFVQTKCQDSSRGFDPKSKHTKLGYSPMVCLIGHLPVFISLRSGNASAAFQLASCMEQCLDLLAESNIKIKKVISDGAGQNKAFIKLLESKGIKYNTRMPLRINSKELIKGLKTAKWRKTEIETATTFWSCEIAEIPYVMEGTKSKSRIITLRMPDKKTLKKISSAEENERLKLIDNRLKKLEQEGKLKSYTKSLGHNPWVNFKGYDYKLIITNDFETNPEALIREYNKRGSAENNFKFMKYDFAWRLPPFMNMNENAVFLFAASLANNIYRGVLKKFKKNIPQLKLSYRLPTFKLFFIDVVCSLINGVYEFYNADIDYKKIM